MSLPKKHIADVGIMVGGYSGMNKQEIIERLQKEVKRAWEESDALDSDNWDNDYYYCAGLATAIKIIEGMENE